LKPSRSDTDDILAIIGADTSLRHVANTHGGEYAGPCPFCGGTDRFRVWPEHPDGARWWCRQCHKSGDLIAYRVERGDLTPAAAGRLRHGQNKQPAVRPRPVPPDTQPPAAQWQARATEFIGYTQQQLWDGDGRALYEFHCWGLDNETIAEWQLGWNPGALYDDSTRWGLSGNKIYLARGLVIPHFGGGHLWGVKIRRYLDWTPAPKQKYSQPRRDAPNAQIRHEVLFGVDHLRGDGRPLLLAEGEKDALLAWQELREWVDVASLAGAQKGLAPRWLPYLLPYRRILAAYDTDAAGDKGVAHLGELSARIRRIAVPAGGDLVGFFQAGGDLQAWIQTQLP